MNDSSPGLLEINLFRRFKTIKSAITTRNGGVSRGLFKSLNLSYKSGDDIQDVQTNRGILAMCFSISANNLFFPDQCHTANIQSITSSDKTDLRNTDALITNQPGIGIGVLAADCVPILFFDPVASVIAAVHAGWKGTVQNIVGKTLHSFKNEYGARPENIHVAMGPCIQQKRYEVGPEVIRAIEALKLKIKEGLILPSPKEGHAFVDLQGINKLLLEQQNIHENKIEIIRLCTFENQELFFSARRDGFHSGRFAGLIMLH